MDENLRIESERLARSWDQYDPTKLREYLVSSVEDPRINVQSILTRHFLITQLFGSRFEELKKQELIFAGIAGWITGLAKSNCHPDEWHAILYALENGSDNAEGLELPAFVVRNFANLPINADGAVIPNYIRDCIVGMRHSGVRKALHELWGDTIATAWRQCLGSADVPKLSVLEMACGSANDYRYLEGYGMGRFLDYTGVDISRKNIENAQQMFPGISFNVGNAFAISLADLAVETCYFHDLLEHLSLDGLERAIAEFCRVTKRSICAGLFSAWDGPEHIVRPMDDYHCNTLSLSRLEEAFRRHGFAMRSLHVDSYVRKYFYPLEYHNPHACTVYCDRF